MAGAARKGDNCTGHSCFNSRSNIQGSPNVYVNDLPAHRQGDSWQVHRCLLRKHGGNLANGSPTVYVNDRQAGRIGDPVNCGSRVLTGSSNVFIGP